MYQGTRANDGHLVRRVTQDAHVRHVRGLFRYPIKSCRGTSLDEATVGPSGIVGDRQWMVVDADGNFLSQRELARMALIVPRLSSDALEVEAPNMGPLRIAIGADGDRRDVTIWDDRCSATDQGDDAAQWFSEFLDTPSRLVRMPDDELRPVDPTYAGPNDRVGFADGFSLLLTSNASLDDLNRRLEAPLPMNRFRPNIVVDGVVPFEEDTWHYIRVDGITFTVAKPCARCAITTTDQKTAARAKEPLRTLATFRNVPGRGVMFGQNLIHDRGGVLHVGSIVEIVSFRTSE